MAKNIKKMKIAVIDNTGKINKKDLEKNQEYWNDHVPENQDGIGVDYEYDFLDIEIKPDYSYIDADKKGTGSKIYFILSDSCVAEIGSKVPSGYNGILYLCERSKSDQWEIYKNNFGKYTFPNAHCHSKHPQENVTLIHHNGVKKTFFEDYNHECHHEIDRHREWCGLKSHDLMDKTTIDGKVRYYYKNNDVYADDGNRARTIKGWIDDWDQFGNYQKEIIKPKETNMSEIKNTSFKATENLNIVTTYQSPNYSRNDDGSAKEYVKTAVTMHSTVGKASGAISWLSTNAG